MSFHAYTKTVDHILPRTGTRSNFVFDSDLVSGNVRLLLDYKGGPISSLFTAPNGTALNGHLCERGIQADFSPDTWDSGTPNWEIQTNKARTTASSQRTITTEASYTADIDISIDVSATAAAGLMLRRVGGGGDQVWVTLDFPSARVHGTEIVSFSPTTKMTGSTVISSGTTYTLRVTAVGSAFNVYLNGSLEGSFTSTVNQTTGTSHGLFANNDTAARFDNFAVAAQSAPVATTYTVRNYDGDVVASGALSGGQIDIADSALTWRTRGPYGWYRVYLTGPDHGDGQWGTAYGDCTFMRIPTTSLPANGTPTQASTASIDSIYGDEIARGVMGLGTTRYSITNASIAAATTIATMTPIVSAAKTWNTDTASAARPRKILVAFPNGTTGNEANVTAIVAGLKTWVSVWECRNEPNFFTDAATWTSGEYTAFHTAVKAGDANATVIGPGTVAFNDGLMPYIQGFLDNGGGAASEAFSLHPYNCYNGDLATMRRTLGMAMTKFAAAGKSAYDIWMTEQGYGWNYAGVVWPHYSCRWTSLMYFGQSCITADKMRPETTAYWYDVNIGFDNFPMQWLTPAGPGPTIGPVRTMSAEIYGKTFTSELDFGTYGKNIYVGGVWTNASTGDKVIGIQSSSYGANPIRLRTTGASSFTFVDSWGNTSALTATSGDLTVPVGELPQWVRVPSGTTAVLEPTDWVWGTNHCLAGTPHTSSVSPAGLAQINDDIQQNHYATNGDYINNDGFRGTSENAYPTTSETFPQTVDITFSSKLINRVVVFCHAPWQNLNTLVDFDLQTYDGSTWTTRKTWTGDLTRSFNFTSGTARCVVETYWHDQYVFDYQFPTPLTVQGVRCYVRNTSYGGFDTQATSDTGANGQNGWGRFVAIREFQAFNYTPAAAATAAPRLRNPAMGGVI